MAGRRVRSFSVTARAMRSRARNTEMTKTLLAGVFLLVSVMAAPATAQFSEPPLMDKLQAGYYRLKIGKVDVIAVSDGAAAFDILSIVPNEKKEAAARIMAKSLAKTPVFTSVNAYVILLGGRTIMVDAGTGELFGVKLGKLPDSLRAAGITPESITDILVTHIHPDHTGGLAIGGEKIFPEGVIPRTKEGERF